MSNLVEGKHLVSEWWPGVPADELARSIVFEVERFVEQNGDRFNFEVGFYGRFSDKKMALYAEEIDELETA